MDLLGGFLIYLIFNSRGSWCPCVVTVYLVAAEQLRVDGILAEHKRNVAVLAVAFVCLYDGNTRHRKPAKLCGIQQVLLCQVMQRQQVFCFLHRRFQRKLRLDILAIGGYTVLRRRSRGLCERVRTGCGRSRSGFCVCFFRKCKRRTIRHNNAVHIVMVFAGLSYYDRHIPPHPVYNNRRCESNCAISTPLMVSLAVNFFSALEHIR